MIKRLITRCPLLIVVCAFALGPATAVAATTPTARFTYSPASPVVGQSVTLDGASSSCPDAPCTYEWSDDGSPHGPSRHSGHSETDKHCSYTFHEAATKYIRLTVTDATGQTSTTSTTSS